MYINTYIKSINKNKRVFLNKIDLSRNDYQRVIVYTEFRQFTAGRWDAIKKNASMDTGM